MHPKHRLYESSRIDGCDKLHLPGEVIRIGSGGIRCEPCARQHAKPFGVERSGRASVPFRCGQHWVPAKALERAMQDWLAGRAYWNKNFRLCSEGSKRGPIAPWNLEVKTYLTGVEVAGEHVPPKLFNSPPSILHAAAHAAERLKNRVEAVSA